MTTQTEALKSALEALEPFKKMFREVEARHEGSITETNVHCQISVSDLRKCLYAAGDIKEALAQPEQEPVAQIVSDANGFLSTQWADEWAPNEGDKLYTTPYVATPRPRRTWVDLSWRDITEVMGHEKSPFVRGIIEKALSKLKEKNT